MMTAFSLVEAARASSDTSVHSLSRLIVGVTLSLLSEVAWVTIKPVSIGTREACPNAPSCRAAETYYFSIMILWYVIPPELPRPLGCFLCFPTLPWPMDSCPLIDLVFFNLATYNQNSECVRIVCNLPFSRSHERFNNK